MAVQPSTEIHPIAALAERMRGEVIAPDHPDYERARRVWNGMIDKRPALIARCADADDVATAVRFAAEHGPGARGSRRRPQRRRHRRRRRRHRHRPLRRCARCASTRRGRTVHVQGGATWADVDRVTAPLGLATPGRGRLRDRRRRPGVERRRLVAAPARRDDRRQPGLGGGRARRRPPGPRERRRAPGPALGHPRRRRQLRRRHLVRAGACTSSAPRCTTSSSPTRSRTPPACSPAGATPSPTPRTSSRPWGSSGRCPSSPSCPSTCAACPTWACPACGRATRPTGSAPRGPCASSRRRCST